MATAYRPFAPCSALTLLLLLGCEAAHRPGSNPPHRVGVVAVQAFDKTTVVGLVGRVLKLEGRTAEYQVTVPLPKGALADVTPGQRIPITLPIIRNQQTQGVVESLQLDKLILHLSQQVQELNGQNVRAEVPIKATGIFRLPFTAIYSPRGVTKQVFVVKQERAELMPVEVISLYNNHELLISAGLSATDRVVTQGLDNLLNGDAVEVVATDGGGK